MADGTTSNYNLTLPAIGSTGWGSKVNQNFSDLDLLIKACYDALSAATGGQLTGLTVSVNGKTGVVVLTPADIGAVSTDDLTSEITRQVGIMIQNLNLDDLGVPTTTTISQMLLDSQDYSLEERIVGKWVDGKPYYRKTFNFGQLPNNTTKTVLHAIPNLKRVLDYDPSFFNETSTTSEFSGEGITVHIDDDEMILTTQSDMSMYTGYVTIYYTKTTD
jgi:hypothetical protein